MRMRDVHVRRALHAQVLAAHRQEPDTLVIDEMGLNRGASRIDVAVINGEISGYEIKSATDTLERLPGQIAAYAAVLDRVTLVSAERHLEHASQIVPASWGIVAASIVDDGVVLVPVRTAQLLGQHDPMHVAQLLWRVEQVDLLRKHGLARGAARLNRRGLCQLIVREIGLECLRGEVRAYLKARREWRTEGSEQLQ